MDYRLYHRVNDLVAHHTWLGHGAGTLESWSIPSFAVATIALWLLSRPGATRKWKLACGSALGSAALALLVNQVIAHAWSRPRPYATHPDAVVFAGRSHDPSFPSDHASAAYAIATAIFLFDRVVGSIFLAAATAIAVGRVVAGVHYPADVLAGALVGAAVAVFVVRLGRPAIEMAVRLVERVTDPLLTRVWRIFHASVRASAD